MRSLDESPRLDQHLRSNAQTHPEEEAGPLQKDPFAASLASHKLKGKLTGKWACTVEFDLRIVFRFTPSESDEEDDIFLLGIGTHDEVY